MADQSEETMEEEEMAGQSQESEQRSMAVVENTQALPESSDLMRAANTQMFKGSSLLAGDKVLHSANVIQQKTSGSGHWTVIGAQNCQFNITQQRSAEKGSDQECTPPKIPKLDNSSQAATSGRSLQPKTPVDGSEQRTHPSNDQAHVASESCKKALGSRYRTTGSYVQLTPWEDNDTKHIEDIFTGLPLEKSEEKLESYKDIFLQTTRNGDPIKRVVLNGLAGTGKSTIIDKMAYDWACNEALQQFQLVFVLRMSAVEQSTELNDSIFEQLLAEDTKIDKGALGSFIKDNEEKVLILLDGFGELMTPIHALNEALFGSILKILNRKKGRDCYVVVTTRTSHYSNLVTRSLVQDPFTQVVVEGFDEEGIENYVTRFYSKELYKAEGLLQRIKSSNVLSDLATSPMLLLFMCILWRDNSTLPETLSRFYSGAMEYIYHRKTDESIRHMSAEEISEITKALGKIGLQDLLAPEQLLAFPEEVFEPSVLESAMKAGILTRKKVLKGIKSQYCINFLCETFQEFCASKYLQSLETDTVEFQKNLDKMINSESNGFECALRFCAGDNMACTRSILETLAQSYQFKKEQKHLYELTPLVQLGLNCYFEGQSKDLPHMEFIQSVLTDTVFIDGWNRDSLNSLIYFLQAVHTYTTANKQTDYLDKVHSTKIQYCHLGGCMSDLAYCMSLMVDLSSVTLHRCRLYDNSEEYAALSGATSYPVVSAASWAHHFKKMNNLQKLHLIVCSLTGKDMTYIAPALCHLPNLVELNLEGNDCLGGSAASWAHHLKKMKNLQKLLLIECLLKGKDMTYIAPALCHLPNLVALSLSGNEALGGSAESWAHYFKKMKNLQELHFSSCSLTGKDMTHIAPALCDLPNLVELNFGVNEGLNDFAVLWAHHFKKMKNLHKVNFSYSLWGEAMTYIAAALCHLPNLGELNLVGNKGLAGSAASWAHHLKEMKNLQKLLLIDCLLTGEDMNHIAPALCHLPNLVELNLEENEGLAGSIASWIHHVKKMKNLQKLNLSWWSLTDKDMTHIDSALDDLPNLDEVKFDVFDLY